AAIEAKLSSVKIIAAASLATSVPVMPIAMPRSACLRGNPRIKTPLNPPWKGDWGIQIYD
ncbi:hypothetical protein, partial [Chamaesiphon sp. OTE_20_metabat_361]|uniref:hypothetical protein n=1 Tax=Chamaesiphon sp. OTE_20_metabat_361 TaxID=2964689 RepID=UPI00286CFF73